MCQYKPVYAILKVNSYAEKFIFDAEDVSDF